MSKKTFEGVMRRGVLSDLPSLSGSLAFPGLRVISNGVLCIDNPNKVLRQVNGAYTVVKGKQSISFHPDMFYIVSYNVEGEDEQDV